jgi:DNA-binding response OmpR family regulator
LGDAAHASNVKNQKPSIDNVAAGETILLVDDENLLLETGEELLSLAGYRILTASSGETALAVLQKEGDGIDMVVMDVMMPGMGGIKCLQEILKIYPAMKVIMASGFMEEEKKKAMIDGGAAAFVSKPYTIDEIIDKIRAIFHRPDES